MSTFPTWVVFDSPTDMPGRFVARKFLGETPTQEFVEAATLDAVREKLPHYLVCLSRSPEDELHIVEVWL